MANDVFDPTALTGEPDMRFGRSARSAVIDVAVKDRHRCGDRRTDSRYDCTDVDDIA